MKSGKATGLAVCALALGCLAGLSPAYAQAPFTIRRPKDGTTVREKLRIEIPRASIPAGGFVALYVDDQFVIALPPEDDEEGGTKPFSYLWDTKGTQVADGEHMLRAVLCTPAGGAGVNEVSRTEVRVTVANKIKDGPSALLLRYRYHEGDNLEYSRVGKAVAVGSLSQSGKIGDESLGAVKGTLRLAVEDTRFDQDVQSNVFLVRNKLTSLSILSGVQEQVFEPTQLSNSMYQEVLPDGRVQYETGDKTGAEEFTALGLPVNNTLELPLLPTLEVSVGSEWKTQNQRIDIPGLPPNRQPRVTLTNKFEGLEWEGGRRTAKIHQTFSDNIREKSIQFGPVQVDNPKVTFSRDIYIAYDSGLLVKTTRQLSVEGTTLSEIGAPTESGVSGGGFQGGFPSGGFAGGNRKGGDSEGGGSFGPYGGSGGPRGASGSSFGPYGGSGGPRGASGSSFGPYGGSGGPRGSSSPFGGGQRGSSSPFGGGKFGSSSPYGGGLQGPGSSAGFAAGNVGAGGFAGLGSNAGQPHKIVLRSSTDTELLPSSAIGVGVDRGSQTITISSPGKGGVRAATTKRRIRKP